MAQAGTSTAEFGDAEEILSSYLDSEEFTKASTNASRLVSRLKSDVQNGQLYQVHQDLRNIYFRFTNHKEKIEALNGLLYHGAIYLLNSKEYITGQDIALLLLEVSAKHLQNLLDCDRQNVESEVANPSMKYHIDNRTNSLNVCQQVTSIAVRLPGNELGQPKFIAEALKILSPKILNRDLLHHTLASSFWRHRDYANARYHFLHCASVEDAEDIASLLVEYHDMKANKKEVDLFLTQFILQLLCLQSPTDSPRVTGHKQEVANPYNLAVSRKSRQEIMSIASKIFQTYTLKHPSLDQVDIPFSSLPLLNFTYFIILLVGAKYPESQVFRLLCGIYKPAIDRDPNYPSYLNRIGVLYFGIVDRQKQQQQQGGFFNNILMSLFEGTDDDSEGDGDEESNQGNNMSYCDELD